MNGSKNIKNVDNKGVSKIYKIFEEIYLKAPTFLKDLSNNSVCIDNTDSIREQIDFKKIDTKFKNGEYCHITDAIKDIRTVFLNCYSFYGARSNHTKQSLELEELLEEKISYLDENFKLLADVNLTLNLLNMKGKPSSKLRYPKDCYDSVLLRSVSHCRPERLKKYHKTLSTTLTTDKDNAHILEKISSWENNVNFNYVFHQYISSMWELPEIGNFLAIIFKKLDLDIINQGEIERMFLMPKESTTMDKVMSTLLGSFKTTKSKQLMPYKVWSKKLSKKVSDWCRVYHANNQNKVIALDLLGIHPDFWTVVNEKNPLIEKNYSELSYFIKVWLVKGLCDYITIKFKTINDIVTNCNARQCTIWKNDLETEEYFFFDSMPDLRIYYYNIPYDEPCLEFLESVKTDNEVVKFEDKLTMSGFSEDFHMIQKRKHFKLIADSVESLRDFVCELNTDGKSVPENLISSLENFIVNIEPEEYNYIAMNNDSKIQLFKDWLSYMDKDNISVSEEKDSKSIAKTKNEELIIAEKRQRKLIVHQNVDTNDSDEYVSENDKSLSDFTDSEDEWGAINQPKFKVKQPQQTPSKLFLELEKRVTGVNKKLKVDTNNLLNTNQSDERNQQNITLVSSKNVSLLKEKDSKSTDQGKNEELIIAEKRQRKLIVHQNIDTNKSDENDKSLSDDFTDSEDEWGAMNQPKFKVKQPQQTPSKLFLELEKRVTKAGKMLKYDTNQSDVKQLGYEDKISKRSTHKMCKTNSKDKSIKSVKLLKTQNEGKICSNNTNTLPLVNGNNKYKQPLQTPKHIRLQKQLREENTTLKHGSLSDSTDSKDAWGAMNQPKFKVKQPQQTPSKLFLELEKRVTGVNKKLKADTNNLLNTNQSDERNQQNITLVSSKNVSVLKEKDSKSTDQAKNEELIIAEKRQRKLIVHQNVDINDSDEYVSENDKSLSDFTDSEDEWGAINQPKFKVKQPQQTPSKLFLELEKRVTGVNKKLKVDTNNLLNTNQSDERNQQNITLVSSKNVSLLKEKDSKSTDQAKNEELMIAEKRQRKLIVHQNVDTNESDENDKSLSDFTDSEDEWGAMNQPKSKVKQPQRTPSKLFLELEKRVTKAGKMLKYDTNQSDVKQLGYEDKISKRSTHKMCKTNSKDKNIKSFKLLKTQNEGKICSNNTNTLPLVNGNNKVKQPLQTPNKRIRLQKQLREENTTLKHGSIKGFDRKDKNIKSFELLKIQNEGKICSNNTNTLPLVNGNNKDKQPLQTPPKRIRLQKQLREENTTLKQGSIKGFDRKDNNIQSFKLLKTLNEIQCSNNTNTFDNGHNQRLVGTKNIDFICSYKEVALIHSDKEESQKPPGGLRRVEIINLDGDMQNDREVFNDNFESLTCTGKKNKKPNKQMNYKQIESSVISIEDDDPTIISDGEDAVQFISMTKKLKRSPLNNNKHCSLKTHLNKSYNSVSANKQITPTDYINHRETSSIIEKLSKNVTIMPANVNIPKGIEVIMVKTPPTRIDSNFNSVKRKSTMSNDHPPDNPSTINVKCELISKPDLNGEVKFCVRLPNGKEHPGPNELNNLINKYLKQHNNQLPDYWLVPLPVEVAKQYGFN